jgi:hypothetical protein
MVVSGRGLLGWSFGEAVWKSLFVFVGAMGFIEWVIWLMWSILRRKVQSEVRFLVLRSFEDRSPATNWSRDLDERGPSLPLASLQHYDLTKNWTFHFTYWGFGPVVSKRNIRVLISRRVVCSRCDAGAGKVRFSVQQPRFSTLSLFFSSSHPLTTCTSQLHQFIFTHLSYWKNAVHNISLSMAARGPAACRSTRTPQSFKNTIL